MIGRTKSVNSGTYMMAPERGRNVFPHMNKKSAGKSVIRPSVPQIISM